MKVFLVLGALVGLALALATPLAVAARDRREKSARTKELPEASRAAIRRLRDPRSPETEVTNGVGRAHFFVHDVLPNVEVTALFALSEDHSEHIGPWSQRFVRDAWGRPLIFRCPGPVHPRGFDLYSMGPNGIDDLGEGDDILLGDDIAPVRTD